jgi:hypothetical protein
MMGIVNRDHSISGADQYPKLNGLSVRLSPTFRSTLMVKKREFQRKREIVFSVSSMSMRTSTHMMLDTYVQYHLEFSLVQLPTMVNK